MATDEQIISLNDDQFAKPKSKRGRRGSKYDDFLLKFYSLEPGRGVIQHHDSEEAAKKFLQGARMRLYAVRKEDPKNMHFDGFVLYIANNGTTVVLGRKQTEDEDANDA